MAKNKKRGQRLIISARQRKRERFQQMTPKQKREYKKLNDLKRRGLLNAYERKLSFKENMMIVLIMTAFLALLSGCGYLIFLLIRFIIRCSG